MAQVEGLQAFVVECVRGGENTFAKIFALAEKKFSGVSRRDIDTALQKARVGGTIVHNARGTPEQRGWRIAQSN